MKEIESWLDLYKEAYPDNPYFQKKNRGKKQQKKEEPVEQKKAEPKVEVDHVGDALKNIADVVALASLHKNFKVDVHFANAQQEEAAMHLLTVAEELVAPANKFKWETAKDNFVSTFSNLAQNSHSQIAHTGLTFHDSGLKETIANNAKLAKKVHKREEEPAEVAEPVQAKKESPKKAKKQEKPAEEKVEAAAEGSDAQEELAPVEEESKRPKTAAVDRKPRRKPQAPKKAKDEDDDGFKMTTGP